MVEDNYEELEKNLEQKEEEGDDISQIEALVVQEYLAKLESQGIKFPKEDPLGFVWTEEKLIKYVEEHSPENEIFPWHSGYPREQFRWIGKKASERERKLEEERRNLPWYKQE